MTRINHRLSEHFFPPYKNSSAEVTFHDIGYDFIQAAETPGLNGGRYDGVMEDRLCIAHDPNAHLTVSDAKALVEDTFRRANAASEKHEAGSTGTLVAITSDHHLAGANLGDSPAFLIFEQPDGELGSAILYEEHSAKNATRIRVERAGGEVQRDRLYTSDPERGGLGLARAFGDVSHEFVLKREPHFFTCDLNPILKDGRRAWLFVTSDGVSVNDGGMTPNHFKTHLFMAKQLVDAHRQTGAPLKNLLEAHLHRAFDDGLRLEQKLEAPAKTDNISIAVAEINPQHQGISLLGVADGHGGHEVAEIVQKQMQHAAEHMRGFMGREVPKGVTFKQYNLPAADVAEGWAAGEGAQRRR